jgi:hypothetical protein
MYCSSCVSGDGTPEDLALARKMVCQQLSGKDDDGDGLIQLLLILVEPLLHLTFKCLVPKSSNAPLVKTDGVIYVNPPTESKDYDDAYHEAKRIFVNLFGEDEEFLKPDDASDDSVEDE